MSDPMQPARSPYSLQDQSATGLGPGDAGVVAGHLPVSISSAALARVLATGAGVSLLLVLAGLSLTVAQGEEAVRVVGVHNAEHVLFRNAGTSLITAGLIILVATPVLREITAVALFLRLRVTVFAAVGAVVFALIVLSLGIGAR